MQQTTYTRVHVSIEGYGTSRNVMSKQEHVSDMIESDSTYDKYCSQIRTK